MNTDPIADFLTRLRNANIAGHKTVMIPMSKIKKEITKILFDQGFILNYKIDEDEVQGTIKIALKYDRLSKEPVIKKLERVKANLNPRTSTHKEGGFHIDADNITTSILYMNTNNGWTEIQGSGKIDCVENRAVTFNSNLMHSGYTCTDQKRKIVTRKRKKTS